MTDVDKPIGFELRDKRSNKSNSGKEWLPADAIYAASKQIETDKSDAVVILWRVELPEGGWGLRWRFSGPADSGAALVFAALRDMT